MAASKKVVEQHDDKIKEELKERFITTSRILYGRELSELSINEVYNTIANVVKQYTTENWIKTNKQYAINENKQIYYFSIEFLLGRLLNTNLINLDLKHPMQAVLKELGLNITDIYNEEPDAGLGNGGLGRLAACFIDSMASLGLPAHGCGMRYQYGLFEQKIINGTQIEIPDNWLRDGFAWEFRKPNKSVTVRIGGNAYMKEVPGEDRLELVHENYAEVMAVPYDVPVIGYMNNTVNNLRLWNAEVTRDFSDYGTLTQAQINERQQYRRWVNKITEYLYPDDRSSDGKRLRLIQEYFFTSAGIQSILRHYRLTHDNYYGMEEKIGIHINDTHPATAVAEMMRILVDEEKMEWEEAWDITTHTMAYTNHTILPEALEKWDIDLFKGVLPRLFMIIEEINRRFLEVVRKKFPGDEDLVRSVSIIENGQVHMAHLAIVGSHSVNGVAKIHSDILKTSTLKQFYKLFPKKFNNKTNGITHRRWLISANNDLAHLIDSKLTRKWRFDYRMLSKLNGYVDDPDFLKSLNKIKRARKRELAQYVWSHNKVRVKVDALFDIQVKRIHSYKRQLMNIMHIMYQYDRLKNDPDYDMPIPVAYFFGGKAAPGYYTAKETIRLINAVADKVNSDESINGKIKVVFIENFGVSLGEMVYPAADVSEQISTASKEASGTGNMKFMMNGAITLGTLDGANVEIHEQVGDENCVIFGLRAEEVLAYYENRSYSAWDEYNTNERVRTVMNQLTDGTYGNFQTLFDYLINSNDEFFILKDFDAYIAAHEEIVRRYQDKDAWLRSSAINIANSGVFSSDRTIKEYAEDIWEIEPVEIK
ncbi:glycogen/starch/alpha-glucan phosphorylase [Anaerovibrio sp.]|uniref:glycogen/starch/alpha-glucan phosphorylase n=1 Tax=Anaerovibrio sp. TaxID=1872532 RepID=UPI0025BB2C30|nr:glycogen/starch/alpha-glucan phosphorylase [Anaerovibrio sp.]MBR2141933.1 glycogen/starch/alpha-glucan phosphorylase [Anaerovibrio sp.]